MATQGVPYISHALADRLVSAAMRKLNGFSRLPNPLMKMPKNLPRLYIYNVSEQTYETPMTAMHDGTSSLPPIVRIPACKPGQKVSEPFVVEGMYAQETLVIDSTRWDLYNGEEIAYEIIRKGPGKHPDLNLEKRGVFISHNCPPKPEEIALAHERWGQTCDELIADGDAIMAQGPTKGLEGNMISLDHKRAARYRGQVRDYNRPIQQMKSCPSCGDNVRDGIAIHVACGAILDEDKYQLMHPDYVKRADRVKPEEKNARAAK